jgi:hypothetical protein
MWIVGEIRVTAAREFAGEVAKPRWLRIQSVIRVFPLTLTLELWLLDELVDNKPSQDPQRTLTAYLIKLARLGGYLAHAHDPPPGNKVMWRGLSRLTDIELGATIGAQLVGN